MPERLRLVDVEVKYDSVPAVHQVSLTVGDREIVALVGANGAGKTTLMRTIAGAKVPSRGDVHVAGQRVNGLPAHRILDLGVAHVPEGRRLFGPLTVEENLQLGAYREADTTRFRERLAWVYELFPVLRDRRRQQSQTLSGGEQQMLAIARGLMSHPTLLLLDEPSLGVMPSVVEQVYELIGELAADGVSVLIADQKVEKLLSVADRAYVLQTGRVVLEGTGRRLLASEKVREAFLGM